ncbi:angiopoietin-related protein 7-like isoform X2 [Saccostrea echinata]|uniref:angiopoietin-related protein 7-like isoform X2 n=1 Tax=Saccostrea echinata TaxID=191078 RepID=UPI002A83BABF|nr:angiopoietin-related protein 7-like isoform X2 [Saccostrea echinata]
MVQKIQSLVMDAIDNKKDGQVIREKLSEVTKELQDLETKNQIMEEENIKLKEELKVMYGTLNNNRNFTKEEIKYLDQMIENKTLALQNQNHKLALKNADFEKQLDMLNKTTKKMESDLRKDIQTLKMKDQRTMEKIKALNESQIVSDPQIKVFKYQMNEMNVTLQKCSVNSLFERVKKTEYELENFPVSVNDTLHTVCRDLNESDWILSKVLSKDCWDILQKYPSLMGRNGVYRISIASEVKAVYCDMSTDGGGWTAIQRRKDNSTDFYRTWRDYKQGFGDPSKNYWIGNDAIYELTKNKDQELRVELQSFDGAEAYAHYSTFYVGDKYNKYVLTVSGYSGTAGDSLAYHSGYKFSTTDQDNDGSSRHCAASYHGAWWYKSCHDSNLNGQYTQSALTGGKYPVWQGWKGREALQTTLLMIRHQN